MALRCDLRSDVVTKPTLEQRQTMVTCEIGCEQSFEDPTVTELEKRVAAILGKEAAVFCTSGIQANLLAILSHCTQRGSEILVGHKSHVHRYEQGNSAMLGGVHSVAVTNLADGTLCLKALRAAIVDKAERADPHHATQRLIVLENTHNACGGRVLPVAYINEVGAIAHENDMALHIDGARLFNAVTAVGVPAAQVVAAADSVSVCFSKGLCAPVGAALAGSKELIAIARRMKKALGGAMRQSGVIAAPCLYALDNMVQRLKEDHENARFLATGLSKLPGIIVDLQQVQTNSVFMDFDRRVLSVQQSELLAAFKAKGLLASTFSDNIIRMMTHKDAPRPVVERALAIVTEVVADIQQKSGTTACARARL